MNTGWLRWLLAGLTLLAAAALTSPPYQMIPMLNGRAVVRMNVWTGQIDFCIPDNVTFVCHPGAPDLPPGFEVVEPES